MGSFHIRIVRETRFNWAGNKKIHTFIWFGLLSRCTFLSRPNHWDSIMQLQQLLVCGAIVLTKTALTRKKQTTSKKKTWLIDWLGLKMDIHLLKPAWSQQAITLALNTCLCLLTTLRLPTGHLPAFSMFTSASSVLCCWLCFFFYPKCTALYITSSLWFAGS